MILGLLGFAAFSNALHGPFLIDDHAFFEEKLQNIKYLPLHFLPDKNRALHIEGESADPFYRPLATIVPMLSWLAFKDNVFGHHALNLVLFVLAAWSFYIFLSYLGFDYSWALLAAGLYLVHPVNGVAVNYITASIFPVQVMLMLLSLYFVVSNKIFFSLPLVGRVREGENIDQAFHHPHRSSPLKGEGLRIFLSIFFYILAMMCHETAIILPCYAFVLLFVFAPTTDFKQRLMGAWRGTWLLFIVLGLYFIWRMQYSSLNESILTKISWYHMSFVQYLATWTMLLSWYVSRLFWPKNIVLIMAHQPLVQGLEIWIFILACLLATGIFLSWSYRKNKFMLLGLLWFLLGFGPFILACFFQPIHGLMIEPHWFLFSVIGFFIFLAGVFTRFEEGTRRWLGRVFLIIFIGICIFFSHWQNWVWADEVRYCKFWLYESPSFVAVNAYLAKAYELNKQFDLARKHYRYILQRGYKEYIAYTNMGLMDIQEGKWDSAQTNLLEVMKIDPHASVAVNDLGVIYFKKGQYSTAFKYFERARDLNRFLILPYLDISETQLKLGSTDKAILALRQALDIVPDNDIVLVNLIKIYIDQKDRDKIVDTARQIVRLSGNPYSIRNSGILLGYYGYANEAQRAEAKAKRIIDNGAG